MKFFVTALLFCAIFGSLNALVTRIYGDVKSYSLIDRELVYHTAGRDGVVYKGFTFPKVNIIFVFSVQTIWNQNVFFITRTRHELNT